jgi:hypothetical protein
MAKKYRRDITRKRGVLIPHLSYQLALMMILTI